MTLKMRLSSIPLAYAIRHIPTGHYLPMSFERGHRHSHDEPTANCIPRLFPNPYSAKSALTQWLRGKWTNSHYPVYEEGYYSHSEQELEVEPVSSRKVEEMEIVTMSISAA